MYGGYGMGFGSGGFGSIVMILFWVFIIIGLILVIKQLWQPSSKTDMGSALSIAAERYARGEISKDEFETIKKTLKWFDESFAPQSPLTNFNNTTFPPRGFEHHRPLGKGKKPSARHLEEILFPTRWHAPPFRFQRKIQSTAGQHDKSAAYDAESSAFVVI